MQDYFIKNPFSEKADHFGFHFVLFLGSTLFFLLLWGFRLPALCAGCALYLFIITLRRKGQSRRLKQKEANLRRRIGGELAIERLLLQSIEKSHFETALLLSDAKKMTLVRILEEGILCMDQNLPALVAFFPCHPKDTVTATQVAHFQRQCLACGAMRGYLCSPGQLSAPAQTQCQAEPAVLFLGKDAILSLFGNASPATDSQLVMLSRRQKTKLGGSRWWQRIVDPQLAMRYARYALLMITLHFLTAIFTYACAAIGLMLLSAVCRCRQQIKRRPFSETP